MDAPAPHAAMLPDAPASDAAAHDQAADAEKRSAPRVPASDVPSITGLRIAPHGLDASLVNISTSGLLAECAIRLKTGSAIGIQFDGSFTPANVEGRVARCSVARVTSDGALRYHVGVAFTTSISLSSDGPQAVVAPPPLPDVEQARVAAAQIDVPRSAVRNRW
jgi:hypothetical protein